MDETTHNRVSKHVNNCDDIAIVLKSEGKVMRAQVCYQSRMRRAPKPFLNLPIYVADTECFEDEHEPVLEAASHMTQAV